MNVEKTPAVGRTSRGKIRTSTPHPGETNPVTRRSFWPTRRYVLPKGLSINSLGAYRVHLRTKYRQDRIRPIVTGRPLSTRHRAPVRPSHASGKQKRTGVPSPLPLSAHHVTLSQATHIGTVSQAHRTCHYLSVPAYCMVHWKRVSLNAARGQTTVWAVLGSVRSLQHIDLHSNGDNACPRPIPAADIAPLLAAASRESFANRLCGVQGSRRCSTGGAELVQLAQLNAFESYTSPRPGSQYKIPTSLYIVMRSATRCTTGRGLEVSRRRRG